MLEPVKVGLRGDINGDTMAQEEKYVYKDRRESVLHCGPVFRMSLSHQEREWTSRQTCIKLSKSNEKESKTRGTTKVRDHLIRARVTERDSKEVTDH